MDSLAVFSSRYAASVDYYAAMCRYGRVAVDLTEHYDKRNKSLNRVCIVGPNGEQSLSVPLCKPNRDMKVRQIAISEHANWRHTHWGALFSAYGRTPFFEYFADDLKAIFENKEIQTVAEFNLKLHEAIVEFLDLPIETTVIRDKAELSNMEIKADFRDANRDALADFRIAKEYYQIWSEKLGFCPNLSIFDLLCNLGREAVYYLR